MSDVVSKEDFFEKAKVKRGVVEVSGIGSVAVQSWTWDDVKVANQMRRSEDPVTARQADAWLISRALLKSVDGPLMCEGDSDVRALGKLDGNTLALLVNEIARFSDVDAEAVVRAGEASAETSPSDSTSD